MSPELDPRVRRLVHTANALDRRGEQHMVDRRAVAATTARLLGRAVMPAGPDPASTKDIDIPVDGGRIRIRLYTPRGRGPHPLYVFLHGGGWAVGTLDERDPRCRMICAGADCVVASVEYRLAPENQYPTAPEDCYAALVWLVEHADDLGIDASRIGIGGESAGGNLAAVVALMARDRGGPALCHQWLDVPAVDLTKSQPSFTEVPDGLLLDAEAIDQYLDAYLAEPDQATEPYASPLFAESHEDLPPAWIMSCEFDKLRDDGVAYAAALRSAGVEVHHEILRGHVHPSFAFTRMTTAAADYERRAIAALRKALHP